MSAMHDLPCTVTNMNHWISMIYQDSLFIQELNEYQLSRTKSHLIEIIQEIQRELFLLEKANPNEVFSSPDLEKHTEVLETIKTTPKSKFKRTTQQQSEAGKQGKKGPDAAMISLAEKTLQDSPPKKHQSSSARALAKYLTEKSGKPFGKSWVNERLKHFIKR